jgi:hypothetical protein
MIRSIMGRRYAVIGEREVELDTDIHVSVQSGTVVEADLRFIFGVEAEDGKIILAAQVRALPPEHQPESIKVPTSLPFYFPIHSLRALPPK